MDSLNKKALWAYLFFAIVFGLIILSLFIAVEKNSKPPNGSAIEVKAEHFQSAAFITLQTRAYFTKPPKEQSAMFMRRVSEIASAMMPKYESVTIEYYINEDGQEQAIVMGEKKIGG